MKILSNSGRPWSGLLIVLCGFLLITLITESTNAAQVTGATEVPAGRVTSARGTATLARRGETAKRPLTRGAELRKGDTIATGPNSTVAVLMADRSLLRLGASTEMKISDFNVKPRKRKLSVRLAVGRVWSRISRLFGRDSRFEVDSLNAVIGVRGTELIVEVDEAGTAVVTVATGAAEIASRTGELRESIGPMMTASYGGTGTIELKPADPARIKAIVDEVTPRPTLTSMDMEALRKLGLDLGRERPARSEPARLDIVDTPAPPLDAEPGAFGAVRVTGKAEFRE